MNSVSFVSVSSNSGKTALIEKIVPILKAGGFRVALIKHASSGFELDKPGKDSRRFEQAGADVVVLEGPGKLAVLKKTEGEQSFEDLEQLTSDVDVAIFEGFKKIAKNKIEVFRDGDAGLRPLCLDDTSILALVSDGTFTLSIPQFDINDAQGVAEFIANKIA